MNDPLGMTPLFPPGFVWGVATSAYQIEGAAGIDGRAPSIWDTFSHTPGAIADGGHGDVACDHYHRWAQDLDIVASLGVQAYRFSVSWPRVRPDGAGAWNAAGMDFYERLVDGLLERGVTPYLTLNHWDLPQALQDEGGWGARDTVHRFVEYAQHVNRRLGDRVRSITTHNEPWVMAVLGHQTGVFAPGLKNRALAMQVSHHLLLSHGLALKALRADGAKAELGIVLNLSPFHPATDSQADRDKARLEDGLLRRWYLDPIYHAKYPDDVLQALGPDAPLVQRGDLADIAQPIDFLGVNYYTRSVVSAAEPWDPKDAGHETTDMGWEIYPRGLTELLVALGRDYPVKSLIVTENGGAFADQVVHGRVHDEDRARYLARHVAAVSDAIAQGAPVTGYMVWSLLDNFEWASGYAKRFGIVHVDYATQRRTLKDSALWYREFLQRQKAVRP
jgi:beta-glucosidase